MDRGLLRGVVHDVVLCELVCVNIFSKVIWVLIYPVYCVFLFVCGVLYGESCVWCGMSSCVFNHGVSVVIFGICYVV